MKVYLTKPNFELMLEIFAAIKELFRFSAQLAENKGKKMSLTEDEIRQRSRNNFHRLKNKGDAVPWVHLIKFYNKQLTPRWQLHAKNQIRDLVKSGADILNIELSNMAHEGRDGNWLIITYMRDTYKREYFIEAK